jgi:hypothetical protein
MFSSSRLHWNYFIALERDLETVTRYIELSENNFSTYSIELARLLFAAASEIDVVAKLLCSRLSPDDPRGNIVDYQRILTREIHGLSKAEVFIPRHELSFKPWLSWSKHESPNWWKGYNNVKHERNIYFEQATLANTLNALGALLIFIFYLYALDFGFDLSLPFYSDPEKDPRRITSSINPESILIRLSEDYYYCNIVDA